MSSTGSLNEKDRRREEYRRRMREENRHHRQEKDPFKPNESGSDFDDDWDGNWEDEWYEEEHLFDDYTPIWEQDTDEVVE